MPPPIRVVPKSIVNVEPAAMSSVPAVLTKISPLFWTCRSWSISTVPRFVIDALMLRVPLPTSLASVPVPVLVSVPLTVSVAVSALAPTNRIRPALSRLLPTLKLRSPPNVPAPLPQSSSSVPPVSLTKLALLIVTVLVKPTPAGVLSVPWLIQLPPLIVALVSEVTADVASSPATSRVALLIVRLPSISALDVIVSAPPVRLRSCVARSDVIVVVPL